jgi:uncharacterized integral membrane protein
MGEGVHNTFGLLSVVNEGSLEHVPMFKAATAATILFLLVLLNSFWRLSIWLMNLRNLLHSYTQISSSAYLPPFAPT